MSADHPEWRIEPGLTDYRSAVTAMEERAAAIRETRARELIWLVEHAPLYTAGSSASPADLLMPDRFPVFATGRGGKYTYHGPGQRVVYVMLDLDKRGRDLRAFVAALEAWIIGALAAQGIAARAIAGKVGVWVETPEGSAKIAAIGVRVRRWVSFHGLSINVAPDLAHFSGIVPCGLSEPVTAIAALRGGVTMEEVDTALAAGVPAMLTALQN